MGTTSLIGVKENNTYKLITCYYDSYLDSAGVTLYNAYDKVETINDLIGLGDIVALEDNTDLTIACHRDRGERLSPAQEVKAIKRLSKSYNYVYYYDCMTQQWMVIADWTDKELPKELPLKDALHYFGL